jgi:hypothetical protein
MTSKPLVYFGIRRLHHFTDSRNVASIRQHGLLSSRARLEKGIEAIAGGNERSRHLDVLYELDQFVHLSLTPDHPMQYVALGQGRLTTTVDIEVDPSVVTRPGVCMSPDIANKLGGLQVFPLGSFMGELKGVEVLYRDPQQLTPWQRKRVDSLRRVEILVPERIEPELLHISSLSTDPGPSVPSTRGITKS